MECADCMLPNLNQKLAEASDANIIWNFCSQVLVRINSSLFTADIHGESPNYQTRTLCWLVKDRQLQSLLAPGAYNFFLMAEPSRLESGLGR